MAYDYDSFKQFSKTILFNFTDTLEVSRTLCTYQIHVLHTYLLIVMMTNDKLLGTDV